MLDKLDITRRTAETWDEEPAYNESIEKSWANYGNGCPNEASKLSVDASVLSIEQQISEMENSSFRPVGYGSAADNTFYA